MSHPKDIDISQNFQDTFGYVEFEEAAIKIVKYLSDDEIRPSIPYWYKENLEVKGWEKCFMIKDVDIDPVLFAMMCAGGWINNYWFPKGSFTVSDGFIERIESKWLKNV